VRAVSCVSAGKRRTLFATSAPRVSLPPLRRSRSGGPAGVVSEAVRVKSLPGRPSFGGRRTTERRHEFGLAHSGHGQRLWPASGVAVKVRLCTAKYEPSFTSRPATPACPTPHCTRRATASFARFRTRVNATLGVALVMAAIVLGIIGLLAWVCLGLYYQRRAGSPPPRGATLLQVLLGPLSPLLFSPEKRGLSRRERFGLVFVVLFMFAAPLTVAWLLRWLSA
jgi:hypothetical protein